jgi:hypothetical protein
MLIASSVGAESQAGLYNHWGGVEIATSPELMKWQPYHREISKDDCEYLAGAGSLDFELRTTPTFARHQFTKTQKDLNHRLTVWFGNVIVFSSWNVCLPVSEEPNIKLLNEEMKNGH